MLPHGCCWREVSAENTWQLDVITRAAREDGGGGANRRGGISLFSFFPFLFFASITTHCSVARPIPVKKRRERKIGLRIGGRDTYFSTTIFITDSTAISSFPFAARPRWLQRRCRFVACERARVASVLSRNGGKSYPFPEFRTSASCRVGQKQRGLSLFCGSFANDIIATDRVSETAKGFVPQRFTKFFAMIVFHFGQRTRSRGYSRFIWF